MRTEPKAGHDGAFIDADDLEAAARAVAVANGGIKAGAAALRWQLRLRRARSLFIVLLMATASLIVVGFTVHAGVWLFDHTLAYPFFRGGWGMWPL
jgi:hypothetical protein